MSDITAAIPRSSSACVSVRFVMVFSPEAPASAVADASGVDGRHSELVLGVGVGHGGAAAGQGLVTRANRRAGGADGGEELVGGEPHGETDPENDNEQRGPPPSPSSGPP